ncbi:MAG: family 43 glycosylhydrolase [Microthrixaceae bacterium]
MSRDRGSLRRPMAIVALLFGSLALMGCGPELGPVAKLLKLPAPQLPETSDPSVVAHKGTYYVYGSDNHLRAPVTRVTDLKRTYTLPQKNAVTSEAMAAKPAWTAKDRQLWAPTVGLLGSRWVMYFSADRKNPPQPNNAQCIGRAWATGPLGPFTPEAKPVACGINGQGGALDPQLFRDPVTRKLWLFAAYGNTENPIVAIPLSENGDLGAAVTILGRHFPWEYHFIENPSMAYDAARRNYILSYSAGKWWEGRYSTGIARCSTPAGPCTSDPSGPWIASSNGRTGPGGLSFFNDSAGKTMAIFSTFPAGRESTSGGRSASIMPLTTSPAVGLGKVVK